MQQEIKTISTEDSISRLKIEDTDIFLEELGKGKGKIIVSNPYGHNYSMFWGAMGDSLKDFICRINSDYFADKLLGSQSMQTFDAKRTFINVRKYIREEIGLQWYQHMEFQKQMREELKSFQQSCEEMDSDRYFVDSFFSSFVNRLDFYLISDRWERQTIEDSFNGISEHWYFIGTKESNQAVWLKQLHKKLKLKLN